AAVEHVVEMARFDEATSLAAAVGAGGAGGAGGPDPDDLRRVATTIAAFHARATPTVRDEDDRAAAARAIERLATEDAELTALLDDPADRATLHAVQRRLRTFVRDRADVLGSRARGGLVRDGHGDLRAEHVLLGDPVRIVDRIEFRDDLRRVDVADDLAFLVMDLAASGAPDAADVLLAAYRDAGGDAGDDALVAFFAARWALVRAKVARLRERDDPAARAADLRESARMLATAERFAWRTLAPLVLVVSGPSGSGKSVLAAEIARRSGLEVCSSDVVRKERAGLDPTARGGEELYGPGTGPATYAELGRRARAVLERAPGVIVDATGLRRVDREALAGALGDRWGDALHVACTAPRAVLQERLERRLSEPGRVSDAGPEVGLAQVVEPLDEVPADRLLPTRTDRPVDRIVAAVTAALDA
ncbi:MAG: AAA family ATPase, partial [Solirubrobacteraceae bacterium]|nr:AAA family ATPase [Solirubrobacteraceae bacterium]